MSLDTSGNNHLTSSHERAPDSPPLPRRQEGESHEVFLERLKKSIAAGSFPESLSIHDLERELETAFPDESDRGHALATLILTAARYDKITLATDLTATASPVILDIAKSTLVVALANAGRLDAISDPRAFAESIKSDTFRARALKRLPADTRVSQASAHEDPRKAPYEWGRLPSEDTSAHYRRLVLKAEQTIFGEAEITELKEALFKDTADAEGHAALRRIIRTLIDLDKTASARELLKANPDPNKNDEYIELYVDQVLSNRSHSDLESLSHVIEETQNPELRKALKAKVEATQKRTTEKPEGKKPRQEAVPDQAQLDELAAKYLSAKVLGRLADFSDWYEQWSTRQDKAVDLENPTADQYLEELLRTDYDDFKGRIQNAAFHDVTDDQIITESSLEESTLSALDARFDGPTPPPLPPEARRKSPFAKKLTPEWFRASFFNLRDQWMRKREAEREEKLLATFETMDDEKLEKEIKAIDVSKRRDDILETILVRFLQTGESERYSRLKKLLNSPDIERRIMRDFLEKKRLATIEQFKAGVRDAHVRHQVATAEQKTAPAKPRATEVQPPPFKVPSAPSPRRAPNTNLFRSLAKPIPNSEPATNPTAPLAATNENTTTATERIFNRFAKHTHPTVRATSPTTESSDIETVDWEAISEEARSTRAAELQEREEKMIENTKYAEVKTSPSRKTREKLPLPEGQDILHIARLRADGKVLISSFGDHSVSLDIAGAGECAVTQISLDSFLFNYSDRIRFLILNRDGHTIFRSIIDGVVAETDVKDFEDIAEAFLDFRKTVMQRAARVPDVSHLPSTSLEELRAERANKPLSSESFVTSSHDESLEFFDREEERKQKTEHSGLTTREPDEEPETFHESMLAAMGPNDDPEPETDLETVHLPSISLNGKEIKVAIADKPLPHDSLVTSSHDEALEHSEREEERLRQAEKNSITTSEPDEDDKPSLYEATVGALPAEADTESEADPENDLAFHNIQLEGMTSSGDVVFRPGQLVYYKGQKKGSVENAYIVMGRSKDGQREEQGIIIRKLQTNKKKGPPVQIALRRKDLARIRIPEDSEK